MDLNNPEILKWLAENPTPKGHKALTQRCWENIRRGLEQCLKNKTDLEICIAWADKADRKHWVAILDGSLPGRQKEILATRDFFALPDDQMKFWENHVQDHPFAPLFAQERFDSMPTAMQDEIKKLL
jgi:hypothetical protein